MQASIVAAAHPWHNCTIIETDNELRAELYAAAYSPYQADKMRAMIFHRHEIGNGGNSVRRFDSGFEDQRMAAIGPGDFGCGISWRYRPSAILRTAEKICETGRRIEARPAKPVDRAIAANEGGGLAIAN